MFKKLALSSMALLAMTPVVASVLPQASVSAGTVAVTSQVESISGSFSETLTTGSPKAISIGTPSSALNSVFLDVSNGGPDSLAWSVAVYDVSTNTIVSDWVSFLHGSVGMKVPLTSTVAAGDSLGLFVRADSGTGAVTFTVS